MTCQSCPLAATYDLTCLDCCARLVLSARPSKRLQEAQIAAIERFGVFRRAQIIEAIKARAA